MIASFIFDFFLMQFQKTSTNRNPQLFIAKSSLTTNPLSLDVAYGKEIISEF